MADRNSRPLRSPRSPSAQERAEPERMRRMRWPLWPIAAQVEREAIGKMVQEHQLSERRACRLVGLSRDRYRHPPGVDGATRKLPGRIVEITHLRRRFGDRRTHDLLRLELPLLDHQRVYRLYSAAKLAVRKRKRAGRPPHGRLPLPLATTVSAVAPRPAAPTSERSPAARHRLPGWRRCRPTRER